MGILLTWLPTRPTHITNKRTPSRLPTILSSSLLPEQATPTSQQTIHQYHDEQRTYKKTSTNKGHTRTMSAYDRKPAKRVEDEEARTLVTRLIEGKKHALHQHSQTYPSADIVVGASLRSTTAPTSRSRTCQTVDDDGLATTLLLLPQSQLPHESQHRWKGGNCPTNRTHITGRASADRDVAHVQPRERAKLDFKRAFDPMVWGSTPWCGEMFPGG
jgi:hypothetical protein